MAAGALRPLSFQGLAAIPVYARVKAKNMSGVETEYLNLGSVLTKSEKANNFSALPILREVFMDLGSAPGRSGIAGIFIHWRRGRDHPRYNIFIQTGLAANREYEFYSFRKFSRLCGLNCRVSNNPRQMESLSIARTLIGYRPNRFYIFLRYIRQ